MMELKCQNCGGQLKFNESEVKVGHGFVIWRGTTTLTCQSCGTQFVRGDDLAEDKGTLGNIKSVINIGGHLVVGGDLVLGNKIVGDKIEGRTRRV